MSNPYPNYKRNTITLPVAEQPAQPQQEPVGSLSVRYHRGFKSMTNTDFDYNGDLPEGDYELYASPPAQRKPLTDEQQIAEALRRHGLTLIKTASGYDVLKLGQIDAHSNTSNTEREKPMSKKPDPYASEEDTLVLLRKDTRTPAERELDRMLEERGASEQGAEPFLILRQIALELMAERKSLMQLFTDPENQPTQYGTVTVEYMRREISAELEACAKLEVKKQF